MINPSLASTEIEAMQRIHAKCTSLRLTLNVVSEESREVAENAKLLDSVLDTNNFDYSDDDTVRYWHVETRDGTDDQRKLWHLIST
jgi:hypothetical protein